MSALVSLLLVLAAIPWLLPSSRERVRRPPLNAAGSRSRRSPEFADLGLVLDLLAAALNSGCSIERSLRVTAQAIGAGALPADLERAADRLAGGAAWNLAWAETSDDAERIGRILAPAWHSGAPPASLVRRAASQFRRRRRQKIVVVAARLGVALVLPLGLCLLPAFVLLGLFPVFLSFGSELLGNW